VSILLVLRGPKVSNLLKKDCIFQWRSKFTLLQKIYLNFKILHYIISSNSSNYQCFRGCKCPIAPPMTTQLSCSNHLSFSLFQLIEFFEMGTGSPCYHLTKGVNVFLMLFFVIFQAFIIFTFPRLNLLSHQLLNRYAENTFYLWGRP
jgi:hypothetical protein